MQDKNCVQEGRNRRCCHSERLSKRYNWKLVFGTSVGSWLLFQLWNLPKCNPPKQHRRKVAADKVQRGPGHLFLSFVRISQAWKVCQQPLLQTSAFGACIRTRTRIVIAVHKQHPLSSTCGHVILMWGHSSKLRASNLAVKCMQICIHVILFICSCNYAHIMSRRWRQRWSNRDRDVIRGPGDGIKSNDSFQETELCFLVSVSC